MIKYILIVVSVFILTGAFTASAQTKKRTQSVTVNLTRRGYSPETFRLRRGIPAKVTFIRQTDDDCGKEVVIPAYGIRRPLPLNQPVTIRFTPKRAGRFGFACGMDMLHGEIIVS